jgi:hypothetical protein
VNKFGGELVNMSRHIDKLCKHLDGTAFYASSKKNLKLVKILTFRLRGQPEAQCGRPVPNDAFYGFSRVFDEKGEKGVGIFVCLLENR